MLRALRAAKAGINRCLRKDIIGCGFFAVFVFLSDRALRMAILLGGVKKDYGVFT
jgi:hypothetical protein